MAKAVLLQWFRSFDPDSTGMVRREVLDRIVACFTASVSTDFVDSITDTATCMSNYLVFCDHVFGKNNDDTGTETNEAAASAPGALDTSEQLARQFKEEPSATDAQALAQAEMRISELQKELEQERAKAKTLQRKVSQHLQAAAGGLTAGPQQEPQQSQRKASGFKYFKFRPRELRDPNASAIQVGQLKFRDSAGKLLQPSGASCRGGSGASSGPERAISQGLQSWYDEGEPPRQGIFGKGALIVQFDDCADIAAFCIETGHDKPECDPVKWIAEASKDAQHWEIVHLQTRSEYPLDLQRNQPSEWFNCDLLTAEAKADFLEEEVRHLQEQLRLQAASQSFKDTSHGEEWKMHQWLDSLGCSTIVSSTIKQWLQTKEDLSELQLMRFVAMLGSRDLILHVLQEGLVLERITDVIWRGSENLIGEAACGSELHGKFSQDTSNFTLSFGELSTFFGGLEALIGAPNPNIREAMESEHCSKDDSNGYWTTGRREGRPDRHGGSDRPAPGHQLGHACMCSERTVPGSRAGRRTGHTVAPSSPR